MFSFYHIIYFIAKKAFFFIIELIYFYYFPMWHIYFILWVAGSGKSTLISNLQKLDLPNYYHPISYKTRPMREYEKNWVDAWFLSKEDFFAQVQAWEFLEYAIVHETDYYGTKFVDVLDNGIHMWKTVVKELDINGLEELKRNRPEMDELYSTIFLNIPENILRERIEKRGAFMSDEELKRRLSSAVVEEQKAEHLCDYIIDATLSPEEVLKAFLNILDK